MVLTFVGKLGALLATIAMPVMGGILVILFGSIVVVGISTLVRAQVDVTVTRNLIIIVGVVLNLALPRTLGAKAGTQEG